MQAPLFGSEGSPCRSCFSFLRRQGRFSRLDGIVEKTASVDFHLVTYALNVHLKINYPLGVNRRRINPAIASTPTPKRAKLEGSGTGVLTKLVSVKAVPYWKTTELPSSLSEISVPFLASPV